MTSFNKHYLRKCLHCIYSYSDNLESFALKDDVVQVTGEAVHLTRQY